MMRGFRPDLILSQPGLLTLSLLFVSTVAHDTLQAWLPGQPASEHPLARDDAPASVRGSHAYADHDLLLYSNDTLSNLRSALDVMQSSWFEVWLGTWPTAIDWTAAVINTHLVSSLATLSKANGDSPVERVNESGVDNEINRYFTHNVAYYFGEDYFSLRLEAYDDMLWVVLGWLESIKFIQSHGRLRDSTARWHGTQWTDAFAHRAHVFYEISTHGWDTSLCGGGMVWSPHLGPYKNAITNELYIAASVGMYLHFPGDQNESPYLVSQRRLPNYDLEPARPHEMRFLNAAVDAYDWLKNSHMINEDGLYTDGFHIHGWRSPEQPGTGRCDERSEDVFTYNQGVILGGLRGLWESTGNTSYLTDGHELIRNVIAATNWDIDEAAPSENEDWAGLGRRGVLEERCDPRGDCSQDSQTFKGIYFHYLRLFCEPLPLVPVFPDISHSADSSLAGLHRRSCIEYTPWVKHNAENALTTRDEYGHFGGWWAANINDEIDTSQTDRPLDYHNERWQNCKRNSKSEVISRHFSEPKNQGSVKSSQVISKSDLNDRGPGRTVETQSGGVALLKCLWELLYL
ncbi:glycoside hydrolase family 76 protein, partial [Polychaeton citri CBS 116435]